MKKLNMNILYILQCLLVFVGLCLQPVYAKDRIRYHINGVDGSTLQTIDEQGVTVSSYRYAPFGEQLALKKLVTNKTPVGFVGGVHDQDDLVYLKHRYYNPIVGRFYQPDPVTYSASGKLGQIHRYQYSRNDPFTFQDPSGLMPETYIQAQWEALWIDSENLADGNYNLQKDIYWKEVDKVLQKDSIALNILTSWLGGLGTLNQITHVNTTKNIFNAERIGSGLKSDISHRAPSFVSLKQLNEGRIFSFKGGDGVTRTLLQTEGRLNQKKGIYEYILEPSNRVSHQRFIENGRITGFPNQKVPKVPQ